jgi:FkbM family methyltransferase
MKTKHKIAVAKIAYLILHACRRVIGAGDEVIVTRRGVRYCLDLSEGIDLAIFLGRYEAQTIAACRRNIRPGQNVLDIGANIGAHTLNFARLVGVTGRVFAFEPTDFAFSKLTRNLNLNPDLASRVTALQCFLGSTDEGPTKAPIYSSWPLVRGENLHEKHFGQPMSTSESCQRRLDDVLAEHGRPKIHFVKLDVDGFECAVLSGAREMISRDRPVFVMELSPYVLEERGASLDVVMQYFAAFDYRFFREYDDAPLPREGEQLAALVGDGAGINVIVRPQS